MNVPDTCSSDCGGLKPYSKGLPGWMHALVFGGICGLILILLGVIAVFQGQPAWRGWAESNELRHPVYAERVYVEDVFRTHVNTWSNLAYVLVGFYVLAFGWLDRHNQHLVPHNNLKQTPALSFLLGAACCYLGVGSGLFHASLTRWGQQLDVAAMYSPLLALIAINLGRWVPKVKWGSSVPAVPTWPIWTGLVLLASFLLYRYKWSMRSSVVLPNLILTVTAFSAMDQFQPYRQMAIRWLALSLLALVAGVTCRQLDVAGRFSGPDAWFQGHALWHLVQIRCGP
jgi:hypothetical protein